MNKKLFYILSTLVLFVSYLSFSSYSTGVPGSSTSGCSCHGPSTTNTSIFISGLPSNYVPNQIYQITLTATNSAIVPINMAGPRAGFSLSVSDGTLLNSPSNTSISGQEINHTSPKLLSNDTVTWQFDWQAPATANGSVLVTASVNVTNFSNSSSGDEWAMDSLTINAPSLELSTIVDSIDCFGGTGAITAMGDFGTQPYTYSIVPFGSGSNGMYSGLTAGTYTILVADANSNTSTAVVVLSQPAAISTTTNITSGAPYTLPWGTIVSNSGTYSNVYTSANGCDSTSNIVVTITINTIKLCAKVFLGGPYNKDSMLMMDNLRQLNVLPTTTPYSPFITTASPSIFAITGNAAIVDWVLVELRSAANNAMVVAKKSVLVQRDGSLVDSSGNNILEFTGLSNGNYFVSVKHRNHLGVMTANAMALNNMTPINCIDFTNTSTALFLNANTQFSNASPLTGATQIINNKRVLYSGNCNAIVSNGSHRFIWFSNNAIAEKEALKNYTNSNPGVSTIPSYSIFDCNLDGLVKYVGVNNDRNVIANTCNNDSRVIVYEQTPN
jgi:hypothetical protein